MADRPRRRTEPMWVGTEAEVEPQARRQSDQMWSEVQLAHDACERALGGPLPAALSRTLRSYLARMIDLGREMERARAVEQQQRAERAEATLERERERANGLARRLSEQRDPRRER